MVSTRGKIGGVTVELSTFELYPLYTPTAGATLEYGTAFLASACIEQGII
jgi:hypothetical protein